MTVVDGKIPDFSEGKPLLLIGLCKSHWGCVAVVQDDMIAMMCHHHGACISLVCTFFIYSNLIQRVCMENTVSCATKSSSILTVLYLLLFFFPNLVKICLKTDLRLGSFQYLYKVDVELGFFYLLSFSFQTIIFISRDHFLHRPLGFCSLPLMSPAALHSVVLVRLP